MRIIRDASEFSGGRAVAALGMFDGVHIGHRALIRRAVRLARELDAQCVVCTFDRHPLSVLRPEIAPEPLLPLGENLKRFERLGADCALVQTITPEYGATPPGDFLRALVRSLRVEAIVAGENYTFGAGGRGDAAMLRAMAGELGYRAEIVPPVMDGDVMCSSTLIRELLARGETAHAGRLMGTWIRKLYLDMDGVLADFDRGATELAGVKPPPMSAPRSNERADRMWLAIREVDHFYLRLKPMPGAKDMFDRLWARYGDACEILTGIPRPDRGVAFAAEDKREWARRELSPDVRVNAVLREEKAGFCEGADCALVDDCPDSIREWEQCGGMGIRYADAESLFVALEDIEGA